MTQSRQLAAIMFTDIVGYTALMGRDSSKAMKLVHTSKEIQKPLVEKHRGIWLKEMGDGVLVRFDSALDAVNCALDIQRTSRADFEGEFRIGIHLGDITIEENDVYGDGVNVASRLQAITDPGGIYISESVQKAIRGQTSVEMTFLGEINLKNVDYGVRTYALQSVGLPTPANNSGSKPVNRFLINWGIAGPIILLLGLAIFYFQDIIQWIKGSSIDSSVAHLHIVLPEDTYLAIDNNFPVLAVSPDGTKVVFVGTKQGRRQLYLKELSEPSIQLLSGTQDGLHPFFSTDGNWIGFIRNTSVMKMAVSGGVPIAIHQITPMSVNRGITWYLQDSLIHTPSPDGGLMLGSASGDTEHPLTEWERLISQEPYYWPAALGMTNSIVFTDFKSKLVEDQNIMLYSLKDKTKRMLISGGSFPKYSREHILFAREGALYKAGFQINTASISEEQLIITSLFSNANGSALFAAGAGTLAYVEGSKESGTDQLVWVDRKGNSELIFKNGTDLEYPKISPDGDKIAVTSFDGPNSDLWMFEIDRNTFTRITSHPGEDFGPVWSPDGKQIAFSSEIAQDSGEDGPGIALYHLDSSDPPKRYLSSPNFGYWEFPLSWSSDGRWLLFASTFGSPTNGLETMSMSDYQRNKWEHSSDLEEAGVFSPDDKFVAYVSDLSGRSEVYVKSFLEESARIQVSVAGGTEPIWSPDGTEIFYREYDKIMAVSVKSTSPLTLEAPRLLFEGSFKRTDYGGGQANYDIAPDGSRFVMINQTSLEKPRVINVILNWDKL